MSLLEESLEEKFLACAINLQGSSSSAESFFREHDPEATTLASVANCADLVKRCLGVAELPSVEAVTPEVLENDSVVEYLDLLAHTPWSTPMELVMSSELVTQEALRITALAHMGFHFSSVKLGGRGKLRGLKYGPVLATIAKAANINHALTATSICAAAAADDLLELRWYARRCFRRQQELEASRDFDESDAMAFGAMNRSLHARDREGRTPLHHASLAGASRAVDFLLSHWTLIHDGAPEPLMDAYEDEDQANLKAHEVFGAKRPEPEDPDAAEAAAIAAAEAAAEAAEDPSGGLGAEAFVVRKLSNCGDLRAGNAALHLAVSAGHLEAARLLLRKGGANPNQRNFLGRTALSVAAGAGASEEMVTLLVDFGARPDIKTNLGQTPDKVALGAGHKALAMRVVGIYEARRQAIIDAHRAHNDLETLATSFESTSPDERPRQT